MSRGKKKSRNYNKEKNEDISNKIFKNPFGKKISTKELFAQSVPNTARHRKRWNCQLEFQDLPYKQNGQEYALAKQILGGKQIQVMLQDGEIRNCQIEQSLYNKSWIRENDVVLVESTKNAHTYVVHKYTQHHALKLKEENQLPNCISDQVFVGNGNSDFIVLMKDGTDVTRLFCKTKEQVEEESNDKESEDDDEEEDEDEEDYYKEIEEDDDYVV